MACTQRAGRVRTMVSDDGGRRRRRRISRSRPAAAAHILLYMLACCSWHGCQASFSGSLANSMASGSGRGASHETCYARHHAYHYSGICFAGVWGLPLRSSFTARPRETKRRFKPQETCGGARSKGMVTTTMMGTTRAKRGAAGRPSSRKGVGKKVRRILEPASPAEVGLPT